jgi:hypothetical protein
MHVYKFRILSEEQNDFVRDIEISSVQRFEDFHNIILQTTGLDGKELASFHITNGKWIKLKEITLIDMMEEQNEFEEEYEDEDSSVFPETLVMKDCKLKDFIDDPHQRMIYEYDFLNLKTFFIELIQISQAKSKVNYPVCVRSVGKLELRKKNTSPEDLTNIENITQEDLSIENIFNDEDSDGIQTNSKLELDDGFEEFKPQ